MPLKYILRNCPLTAFEISNTNADGTRRSDSQMQDKKQTKASKQAEAAKKDSKSNA